MSIPTIRLLMFMAMSFAISACTPPFEARTSETAQNSYSQCERGGKACVLKPMATLLLDDGDPGRDFQLSNWILIDPRETPGQHYIAFMNEANEPVCEGYYTSYVLTGRAPLAMTCGNPAYQGRGEIHFWDRQEDGPFAGQTTGTGLIKTATATILFIHGVTSEEAQQASFAVLWRKYRGPTRQRELTDREIQARRVTSFPAYLTATPSAELRRVQK